MNDLAKARTLRMSNRYSNAPRWIEGFLLATGLALLLVYLAAWIHGTVMYGVGLWNFVRLRSTASVNNENRVSRLMYSLATYKRLEAFERKHGSLA
jgi:hypothetical protein